MTDGRMPTDAERKSFLKAASILRSLGDAGLYIYLADDSLNLMSGPSHDDNYHPRPDRIVESITVPGAGGGGW